MFANGKAERSFIPAESRQRDPIAAGLLAMARVVPRLERPDFRVDWRVPSMAKTTLQVKGMTCPDCKGRVEKALRSVPGVADARSDWRSGSCEVVHADGVAAETLTGAVERAARGSGHRYQVVSSTGVRSPKSGRAARLLPPLLLGLLCLPCAGVAVGVGAIVAFLTSSLGGVLPAVALGVSVLVLAWWMLRRRAKAIPRP